jgi:hypothetical protein
MERRNGYARKLPAFISALPAVKRFLFLKCKEKFGLVAILESQASTDRSSCPLYNTTG